MVSSQLLAAVFLQRKLSTLTLYFSVAQAYNVEDQRSTDVVPPSNYMALISLRAKIQGFIVTDYVRQFKEAKQNMVTWISEGKLKFKEDVRVGLDSAPEYLNALFNGGNTGKLIVKVGDPITGTPPHQSRL